MIWCFVFMVCSIETWWIVNRHLHIQIVSLTWSKLDLMVVWYLYAHLHVKKLDNVGQLIVKCVMLSQWCAVKMLLTCFSCNGDASFFLTLVIIFFLNQSHFIVLFVWLNLVFKSKGSIKFDLASLSQRTEIALAFT